MPLNTPSSANEVIDRAINDVFLSLREFGAKPALRNSWLRALIVAYCNRVFDFYFALDQAALEALPDTAVDNLERWAAIYRIARKPGSPAVGTIIATGTVGSVIPEGTVLVRGDGFEYVTVDGDKTIANLAISVSSITRSGSTATLTSSVPLGTYFSSRVKITVTGANEAEYNVVDADATITGTTTLTYEVEGTPSTPATGTIQVDADVASLVVSSSLSEEDANIDSLGDLQFESPIIGVDEFAQANFAGVTGAGDQETDDELRARLLDRIQNPVAHFNVADIVYTAKQVPGVTRVFVLEITPAVGQVTVYFMRDNDPASPIPSGAQVAVVKAALDLIRPANTAPEDLIVLAPTEKSVDFTFGSITPNTASMKAAVKANLAQFFQEETDVGVSISQDAYRSVIFNTVDSTTGEKVSAFTLTNLSGTIPVADGEIATLGNVTI